MISRSKHPWSQEKLNAKLDLMRKFPKARYSFEGAILCNLEISDIEFGSVSFVNTNMAGCSFKNVVFSSQCKFLNTCMVGIKAENTTAMNKQGLILSKKKEKQ